MNQVKKDISLINKGILPDSLNFTLKEQSPIDWNKVRYNSLYKDFSYHEKKFPDGYDSISGFDKIIEEIAKNAKTPLEEIIERQNESSE
jgi:hypothetical protein